MIQVQRPTLSKAESKTLSDWQSDIDSHASHETRRVYAQTLWERNRRRKAFESIEQAIQKTCFGAGRCVYCEDSGAHQVEHIRPKHHYPRQTFDPRNLTYACGWCNGPKLDRWKYFHPSTSAEVLAQDAIEPPVLARDVMIHPVDDDPLSLLWLDLETFYFVPNIDESSRDFARASWTIEVLHLNDRDAVVTARGSAYNCYVECLSGYIASKQREEGPSALVRRREHIQRMSHQTVWAEMKRQNARREDLRPLFTAAPEALTWQPLPWR